MPRIIITASSSKKLPAPILLQTWLDEWSPVRWNDPYFTDNKAIIKVDGLTPREIEETIIARINEYNQSHQGMDSIIVNISA